MPIYEYQCGACEHKLEKIQKMSDDQLVDCPLCHKPKLKKLVSAAAFRLKGKGWYETDFKTGSKKNVAESSSSPSSSDSGKSESGGSSKSESKSSSSDSSKSSGNSTAS
ncbi:MAG: putative FmdB family regulatory protein [Candidatus Azotimanducaceae bacterium]|jgi:putative FmdB family regulatory protein